MPFLKPRTLQWRTVAFSWPCAAMPFAVVLMPPPSPPTLNWLQSMVTLLAAMVMAAPLVIEVETFLRRHHVPWLLIVAGSESMKPTQVLKVSAACAGGEMASWPASSNAPKDERTSFMLFSLRDEPLAPAVATCDMGSVGRTLIAGRCGQLALPPARDHAARPPG